MIEIELDLTQDIEELLERIDIIAADGWNLVKLTCYRKSKKVVAKFERWFAEGGDNFGGQQKVWSSPGL